MVKYNEKTQVLTFTGKDEKLVREYAKAHDLTFRESVIGALHNGIMAERLRRL